MFKNHVCPKVQPPTDGEVREILQSSMLRLTMGAKVTLGHAARDLCVDEKTAQRIRNGDTLAKATTIIGMFWQDPDLRAALLSQVGERAVKVERSAEVKDALPHAAGLTHHLALVQAATSDGGSDITDQELLSGRALLLAAHEMTTGLVARLQEIDAGQSGRAA